MDVHVRVTLGRRSAPCHPDLHSTGRTTATRCDRTPARIHGKPHQYRIGVGPGADHSWPWSGAGSLREQRSPRCETRREPPTMKRRHPEGRGMIQRAGSAEPPSETTAGSPSCAFEQQADTWKRGDRVSRCCSMVRTPAPDPWRMLGSIRPKPVISSSPSGTIRRWAPRHEGQVTVRSAAGTTRTRPHQPMRCAAGERAVMPRRRRRTGHEAVAQGCRKPSRPWDVGACSALPNRRTAADSPGPRSPPHLE